MGEPAANSGPVTDIIRILSESITEPDRYLKSISITNLLGCVSGQFPGRCPVTTEISLWVTPLPAPFLSLTMQNFKDSAHRMGLHCNCGLHRLLP